MKRIPDRIATAVLLTGLAIACARITAGCALTDPKTEAGASYAAMHLSCVDNNTTKSAIDACRARVRSEWSVDGGADR